MKKIIHVLSAYLFLALTTVYGSCPSNYTTSTVVLTGLTYSVCYPSVVSLSVNSGQFSIYITINNTSGSATTNTSLKNIIPGTGFTPLSGVVTSNPANGFTSFSLQNEGGLNGAFVYSMGIVAGGIARATVNMQATTPGMYSFSPLAINGGSSTDLPPVTITVLATCTTITAATNIMAGPVCAGSSVNGALSPYVTGGTPPYTYGIVTNPADGTVNLNGSSGDYTYTADDGVGPVTDTFQFQVTDVAGCTSNTGQVNIPINPAPVAPNPYLFNNSPYYTPNPPPVNGTVSASSGTPPYTFTVVPGSVFNGTLTSFNSSTGDFTFTQASPGASSFQYSITDSAGCSSADEGNGYVFIYSCTQGMTAAVTQAPPNIGFSLAAICYPATVSLGETFTMVATLVNPTNTPRADEGMVYLFPCAEAGYDPGLSFVGVTSQHPALTVEEGGLCNQGGDGDIFLTEGTQEPFITYSVDYTVLATETGPQTFIAQAPSNPPAGLTISIDVVTCAPITALDEELSSCSNTIQGNLSNSLTGGTLPYTIIASTPTCGTVTISGTGLFTFTGVTGSTGPCSFQYSAIDVNGCTSSIGTVTGLFNNGPIVSNTAIVGCETINGNLSSQVSGGNPPYVFSLTGPTGCSPLVLNPNGTFSYTAPTGFSGTCDFGFQVTDASGCAAAATASLTTGTIVATPKVATTCSAEPIVINLLAGDTSCQPPLQIQNIGTPLYGTVINNGDGTITYVPSTVSSEILVDVFTYSIIDGAGNTASSTVTVTLLPGPIATNATAAVCGNSYAGNLAGLVSGGALPYTFSAGASTCGSVTVDPVGTFVYTGPTGYTGACTFTYQVTDASGCTGTGQVTVNSNHGPSAGNTVVPTSGQTAAGSVAPRVTGGTQPYTFSLDGAPTCNAAVTVAPNGQFNFTAATGLTGPCSFNYEVTDALSCTAVGTVTVSAGPICPSGPTGAFFTAFVEKFGL